MTTNTDFEVRGLWRKEVKTVVNQLLKYSKCETLQELIKLEEAALDKICSGFVKRQRQTIQKEYLIDRKIEYIEFFFRINGNNFIIDESL